MINVQNLSKSFGPKLAVNNVSFTVERGEVLGFLGPNGAGKSTTMRMVTGFIPPSAGTIRVGQYDMLEQPILAKRLIGYLPENAPLYADMTVYQFLGFAAEIRGYAGEDKKKAIHRVVEMCFLENVLHQSVETLSKGYRHRTCFAQSIIHDPEVLVMDEPTDGLDPNQKHEVRTLIRRMGEKKAIVFSTHILEEVEAACTRALIIDRGRIVANGTPQELKRRSDQSGVVRVQLSGVTGPVATQRLSQVALAKKVNVVQEEAGRLTLRVYPQNNGGAGDLARQVGEAILQEKWRVEELYTEEGRLDEVFRNITISDTVTEVRS